MAFTSRSAIGHSIEPLLDRVYALIEDELNWMDAAHEGHVMIRLAVTPFNVGSYAPPFEIWCEEGCHYFALRPVRRKES
jgi:hypothetical protein